MVRYTFAQKITRCLIVGSIMTLIVFLSKTLGSFWGGIFSVFPAAYTSTLLILHKQYDARFLQRTCRTMPLGSMPIIVYAFLARWTFPVYGFVWGTVLSYIGAAIFFWVLLRCADGLHVRHSQ